MGLEKELLHIRRPDGAVIAHCPWVHSTGAPTNPKLQAATYEGAARSTRGDLHIQGIYFYT